MISPLEFFPMIGMGDADEAIDGESAAGIGEHHPKRNDAEEEIAAVQEHDVAMMERNEGDPGNDAGEAGLETDGDAECGGDENGEEGFDGGVGVGEEMENV